MTFHLLQFIKKAQGLGFRLSEIKEILELRRSGDAPCVHVRASVGRKIAKLDQTLKDLVALRRKLQALRAEMNERAAPGWVKPVVCPHIEAVPRDPMAGR
ncbi:MAG: MerR family DNA-binding protein [candidate division NC10 bacterium]|nr:MerR family DNA-binding protein [candidate division NC10 bacterium]